MSPYRPRHRAPGSRPPGLRVWLSCTCVLAVSTNVILAVASSTFPPPAPGLISLLATTPLAVVLLIAFEDTSPDAAARSPPGGVDQVG